MTIATAQKQEVTGIPLPEYAPQVVPLGMGATKEVAAAATRKYFEEYGDHPYMQFIAPKNGGPIMGSNTFIRYGIAPHVEKEGGIGYRLTTPPILEKAIAEALKANARGDGRFLEAIKQFYENPGVVAYEQEGPNKQLRKHLLDQLRERGVQLEFPILFYKLRTVKDEKFKGSNGLKLDLADEENVAYHAPILLRDTSNFKPDDSSLIVNGLPSQLGQGDRTLYTPAEKTGLRRLFRSVVLGLGADVDYLPDSDEAGRVSFLVGAAPQNLSPLEAHIVQAVREFQLRNR